MKIRTWCVIATILLGVSTGGCAHRAALRAGVRYELAPPPAPLAPQPDPALTAAADRVLILQSGPDRPCEVIGLVDEHGHMGQEQDALARLRLDAARMGGDAVVDVEFHHADGHDDHGDEADSADHVASADPDTDASVDEGSDPLALHLSGTVVRFRDLIGGRRYEVISHLQVQEPMTEEHEALVELERRAAALHADLVVDVQFHHGHGEEPLEVDGTAVRFVR